MRLKGERILIRDLSFKDLEEYYSYASNPNIGPNAGWKPVSNKEVAKRMLAGQILSRETYAIALLDSNKFIGSISLYNYGIRKYKFVKSIGFSLDEKYWGHGYMTEACKLIIDYAFTKTDCEVLEIGHHSDNFRSKSVIERCGFIFDGRLCKYKALYDGRVIDADFYSMTKEDYERKKKYE